MSKKKVLIPTALDGVAKEMLEKHGGYEVLQKEKWDVGEALKANPDAHAIIVRSEKVTAEAMDAAPGLKVIVRAGAGYNTIDIHGARERGIDVMNTPGANSNAVAEEVVALVLADARHVVEADVSCRAGKWEKSKFMGRELTGKTVGIVGLGYIGQLVAKRLKGFEVRLLGYDPFTSEEKTRGLGIERKTLAEVFAESDIVTLHIPENEETRGLVGAELLGSMKEGATLVNCARAGILDEAALRAAKGAKKLRFLNDVYPKDAEGPKSVADVADLMMPHLGASTKEANRKAAQLAAQELMDLDDKGVESAVVNREVPAGLDPAFAQLANTLTRLARKLLGPETRLQGAQTRFYGSLKPYADWLVKPVAAGLSAEYDRGKGHKETLAFLKDMGVDYAERETEAGAAFENSIAVELTGHVDAEHLVKASVRGTVEEGNLLVARMDDFDKLYLEPQGNWAVFTYEDRPGVLGQIAAGLAEAGVNIDDVRNPHDSRGHKSLAVLRVNRALEDGLVEAIGKKIAAEKAFHVEF